MSWVSLTTDYLRFFFQSPLEIEAITCPLTLKILVKPIKTNCGHDFEQLALAMQFRTADPSIRDNCGLCRARITSVDLDNELIKKIQYRFVKTHGMTNKKNKKIFDDQKKELDKAEEYDDVRGVDVIPQRSAGRREEILEEFRGLADFLESSFPRSPPRASYENYERRPAFSSSRSNSSHANIPRRLRNSISSIRPTRIILGIKNNASYLITKLFTKLFNLIIASSESLLQKVDQCIRNGSLAQAEIYASRISDSSLKNQCYPKIAASYLDKASLDLANFDNHLISSIRTTRLITNPHIKNNLFQQIAQKYIDNDNLLQAKSIVRDDIIAGNKDELFEKICSKFLSREYSLSNTQEVLSIIPLITYGTIKDNLSLNLLNKCIAINDFENAENAIEKLCFTFRKQAEYSSLFQVLINSNSDSNLHRALHINDKIESYFLKNINYRKVSFKFAEIRCFKDAYKIVSKITNPATRRFSYFLLTIKIPFSLLYSIVSFPFRKIISWLKKER
ncbi:MAG: hypothetical protein KR126chlam4_00082 [Candidatus Anoxychlamydiales bacterium]|nr:hypothetical protein [Candidatus Anoxychlamydiales bacterium]